MFGFAGFRTDWLRREQAMKTSGRENPNRCATVHSNRDDGAADQNRSCSIKWAAKQETFRPLEMCFFLTSAFIELTGSLQLLNPGRTYTGGGQAIPTTRLLPPALPLTTLGNHPNSACLFCRLPHTCVTINAE